MLALSCWQTGKKEGENFISEDEILPMLKPKKSDPDKFLNFCNWNRIKIPNINTYIDHSIFYFPSFMNMAVNQPPSIISWTKFLILQLIRGLWLRIFSNF